MIVVIDCMIPLPGVWCGMQESWEPKRQSPARPAHPGADRGTVSTCLVISPRLANPDDADISNEVMGRFSRRMPTVGVCLAHQCAGEALVGGSAGHHA